MRNIVKIQMQKEFDPIVSSYFLALKAAVRHSLQAFIAASRLLLLLLVYDRNQVSVSATETKIKFRYRFWDQNFFCLNLNFPPFEKSTKNHFSYYLKDKEKHLDSQNDTEI